MPAKVVPMGCFQTLQCASPRDFPSRWKAQVRRPEYEVWAGEVFSGSFAAVRRCVVLWKNRFG